jgi:hypothetical protein
MEPTQLDMAVHHGLIRHLIDSGRALSAGELSRRLAVASHEIEASLRRLEASHALVLHPHCCEVWLIHPFSTSPTHTWVASGERGWWAPCLWCALGIASLVAGEITIHTRVGGESEPLEIRVKDGRPDPHGLWAHFPEPPRVAWGNVHHYCARLLPFRSKVEISLWCQRHGLPLGEAIEIAQLAELARRWYGGYARPDWRKFTVAEAAELFQSLGLTGPFWQLDQREGAF